jgi:hypothetical protein
MREVGTIALSRHGDERGGRRAVSLRHLHLDMPATPQRIWHAIQA